MNQFRIKPESPLSAVPGIGTQRAKLLGDKGFATAFDLVLNLPRRYQDWRDVKAMHEVRIGMNVTLKGSIVSLRKAPPARGKWRRPSFARLRDEGNRSIGLVWFNAPSYLFDNLPLERPVLVHGKVSAGRDGSLQIAHPQVAALDQGAAPPPIQPVYRGIAPDFTQRMFRKLVADALDAGAAQLPGAMPPAIRARSGCLAVADAIRLVHFPPHDTDGEALRRNRTPAHRALALDELFAFELLMLLERRRAMQRAAISFPSADGELSARFRKGLPFEMTAAQLRAMEEIRADMTAPHLMNRLLMGDVGSGKTVVALWAALHAIEGGYQAAIMAPTELLAEQHFATFNKFCARMGINAALLTGNTSAAARTQIFRALRAGVLNLIVGTHALIQEQVQFSRLGLTVIDEQHRFGVFERARLKTLGPTADMLLMSATPIPRSLALVMFASLEISTLDELPRGKAEIETAVLAAPQVEVAHQRIREQIAAGMRAYYVVPLVQSQIDEDDEEANSDEEKTVAATAKRLGAGDLKKYRIGTLHGRMRPAEKDATMRAFRDGKLDVLVSTTVVEVGIDVAEATVMVILEAEHYGLAQLHQLRGRVGRGQARSYCYLVMGESAAEPARERLRILEDNSSGTEIARADLNLRGPGDLFGARQSGDLPLRFADFIDSFEIVEQARELAEEWLRQDPQIEAPESAGARDAIKRMLSQGFSLADVG